MGDERLAKRIVHCKPRKKGNLTNPQKDGGIGFEDFMHTDEQ
jgi:hypothetical protein